MAAGHFQDLLYKLSKVGQAIETNDLSRAGSVLGRSTDTDLFRKVNLTFSKLIFSPEENTEVETFKSSLASLISSVTRNEIESSKTAFVSSATALEKWLQSQKALEKTFRFRYSFSEFWFRGSNLRYSVCFTPLLYFSPLKFQSLSCPSI